jgi:hypothetical protein
MDTYRAKFNMWACQLENSFRGISLRAFAPTIYAWRLLDFGNLIIVPTAEQTASERVFRNISSTSVRWKQISHTAVSYVSIIIIIIMTDQQADVINWDEAMQQVGEDEDFLRELLNDLRVELESQLNAVTAIIQVRMATA